MREERKRWEGRGDGKQRKINAEKKIKERLRVGMVRVKGKGVISTIAQKQTVSSCRVLDIRGINGLKVPSLFTWPCVLM